MVIEQLDPQADAAEIVYRSAMLDLAWEYRSAWRLALAQRAVPTGVLDVDDLLQLVDAGLNSPTTAPTMRRLEDLAQREPATARRLLAVLATEPARFTSEYGWRDLLRNETTALIAWFNRLASATRIERLPRSSTETAALAGTSEYDHARLREAVRDVLLDAADRLPSGGHLGSVTRRAASSLAGPLGSVAALARQASIQRPFAAIGREVALTRRSVVLLMPSRSDPRDER